MKLTSFQLCVLENHLRLLRQTTAQAAAVTLDELEELLRVYRLSIPQTPADDDGTNPQHSFGYGRGDR